MCNSFRHPEPWPVTRAGLFQECHPARLRRVRISRMIDLDSDPPKAGGMTLTCIY